MAGIECMVTSLRLRKSGSVSERSATRFFTLLRLCCLVESAQG
jgi:hypothetical protein